MKKRINFTSLVSLGVLVFTQFFNVGCTKPSAPPSAANNAESAAKAPPREVNLAIWGNYITPEMISDFEALTSIKVNVSNYASNEELLAKLQAGGAGYDVAVPSDYMVKAMAELNLLETIDKAKIDNLKSLDPFLLKKYFDAENKVSLPWAWGTTGIAVNTSVIKTPIKGWKDLFENKSLSGKFTLLDDVRESLGAALKAQALSLNSTNLADLQKGRALLSKAKDRVKAFTSETQPGLVNGEMAVAHAYSCDSLQAREKTNGKIQYVLPQEGFTMWIDNLVIPKGGKNVDAAHTLINYLLSAKVEAARAEHLWSAPSNKDAIALLPQAIRDDKALFPDPAVLAAKSEMIQDVGESLADWDKIWTEVKASRGGGE